MFNQIKNKKNEVGSKKAKNLNSANFKKKQDQKEIKNAEPIYLHQIEGRKIKEEFKFLNELTKSYIKDKEIINSSEFRSLNRYSNILPFKENLVKLNNSEINIKNYIHANYILDKTGDYSKSKYIITQGPKENTYNEFWKMVEINKSKCIVGIIENNKMGKKCFPYWPNEKPIESEDYIIISIFSKKSDFICHRKLKVFNKKKNKQFECDHYHIFDWEDHSIIKKEFFFEFYDLINKLIIDKNYKKFPIVTHCSAGVGRSGTFVSCLFLIEKLIKTKNKQNYTFSIFNTVLNVRNQRNRSIKRFSQYKFLYDFLLSLKNSF